MRAPSLLTWVWACQARSAWQGLCSHPATTSSWSDGQLCGSELQLLAAAVRWMGRGRGVEEQSTPPHGPPAYWLRSGVPRLGPQSVCVCGGGSVPLPLPLHPLNHRTAAGRSHGSKMHGCLLYWELGVGWGNKEPATWALPACWLKSGGGGGRWRSIPSLQPPVPGLTGAMQLSAALGIRGEKGVDPLLCGPGLTLT